VASVKLYLLNSAWIASSRLACFFVSWRLSACSRLQLHGGAAGFGQAYRDRLSGRTRSMLALSHMVHLFSHKFSGLCAERLSFTGVFVRAFDGFPSGMWTPPH